MNSILSRADVYTLKMPSTETLTAILTARRPAMETALTTVFFDQLAVEELVRATLAGISGATAPTVIQMAAYQAASKQFMRTVTAYTGGGICDKTMAALIAKWAARGLSGAVLTQIAYEIFHWAPPSP